jgi:hypothetical protein
MKTVLDGFAKNPAVVGLPAKKMTQHSHSGR